MSDVDGAVVWNVARISEVGGHSPRALLEELGVKPRDVQVGKRVPWATVVALSARIHELAGDDATLIEWSRSFVDMVPGAVRVAFAATLSPKNLWKFSLEVTRWAYPATRVKLISATSTTCEFSQFVKEPFADTRAGRLMIVGSMAGCTRHLGLPDASVRWDLKPRFVWVGLEISAPPTAKQRVDMVDKVIRGALGLKPPGSEMAPVLSPEPELQESPRERALRLAAADWELTPRQSEVVALLLAGAANKEIAEKLDCALKTAEHHVSAVIRAANCQTRGEVSHALWQLADSYDGGYMPGGATG